MTDFTDLTDAADLLDFKMPYHYGPEAAMPCFACFLEALMEDGGRAYAGRPPEEYIAAMDRAMYQIAVCLGRMFLELTSDADESRERFVEVMDNAMNGVDGDAPPPAHHH